MKLIKFAPSGSENPRNLISGNLTICRGSGVEILSLINIDLSMSSAYGNQMVSYRINSNDRKGRIATCKIGGEDWIVWDVTTTNNAQGGDIYFEGLTEFNNMDETEFLESIVYHNYESGVDEIINEEIETTLTDCSSTQYEFNGWVYINSSRLKVGNPEYRGGRLTIYPDSTTNQIRIATEKLDEATETVKECIAPLLINAPINMSYKDGLNELKIYGNSNDASARLFLGQTAAYGGGIGYEGGSINLVAKDSPIDSLCLFNGLNETTAYNKHNSKNWTFNGRVNIEGNGSYFNNPRFHGEYDTEGNTQILNVYGTPKDDTGGTNGKITFQGSYGNSTIDHNQWSKGTLEFSFSEVVFKYDTNPDNPVNCVPRWAGTPTGPTDLTNLDYVDKVVRNLKTEIEGWGSATFALKTQNETLKTEIETLKTQIVELQNLVQPVIY